MAGKVRSSKTWWEVSLSGWLKGCGTKVVFNCGWSFGCGYITIETGKVESFLYHDSFIHISVVAIVV